MPGVGAFRYHEGLLALIFRRVDKSPETKVATQERRQDARDSEPRFPRPTATSTVADRSDAQRRLQPARMRKYQSFISAWRTGQIDPLLPFPISPQRANNTGKLRRRYGRKAPFAVIRETQRTMASWFLPPYWRGATPTSRSSSSVVSRPRAAYPRSDALEGKVPRIATPRRIQT